MPEPIESLIEKYLEAHKKTWAASTLKSERARLNSVAHLIDGNAESLWDELCNNNKKPYTRVSVFTRVGDFWQWLLFQGYVDASKPNPYHHFRRENARLFKNAYTRQIPALSFAEARERIQRIEDPLVRRKAQQLLEKGLRYSESFTLDDAGWITGKGGKRRPVYGDIARIDDRALYGKYTRVYRALKNVGLKSHDLRKVFLNECIEQGADPFDLKDLAGWSSVETAVSYIRTRDKKLHGLVNKIKGSHAA